ncbi:MAG: type IV secretory system conjugative DNA transfer family protein [Pseudomonadota bacterium]
MALAGQQEGTSLTRLGTTAHNQRQSLADVRDRLMSDSLEALWGSMERNTSFGQVISGYGSSAFTRNERELASVTEIARNALRWLDSPAMSASVERSTFSMRELKEDKVTLYIVLPAAMGDYYGAWTRILFNAAFDAMQDMSIPKPADPVLFMMDEFPLMGYMARFKKAAGEAAKFGVKLFICVQNVAQLQEIYGMGWETFIANSSLVVMFASNDLGSRGYLSARLGKHWVPHVSKSFCTSSSVQGSSSTSGSSTTYQLEDIARGEEIERMASREAGRAFFFIPGHKPMWLHRSSYYQWNMIPEGLVYEPCEARHNPDLDIVAAE